jgi:predicted nucleotidyltransferase
VPQSTVAKVELGTQQPSVAMLERLVGAAGFRLDVQLANARRPSEMLAERRADVARVLASYPISRVWVFGSVARGDDQVGSDLDVLVELEPGASFGDYVGLKDDLASVLDCPVDVVTTRELDSNEFFRRRVERNLTELDVAA